MTIDRPVKVRIAPSPTGDPHVGTAYVGLFNMAYARKHGGRFVLRVEDTDQTRSTREAEEAIYRSLRWAGIEWDEGPDIGGPCGPYRQSERLHIYREHLETLLANGSAYRCTCTAERLAALRKQQEEDKSPFRGYDGHCRERSAAEIDAEIAAGTPYVVRLKVPQDGVTVVQDLLRGAIEIQNAEIDDQVLQKGDGFPTYHLANVIDDYLMGITHVIRGEEWLKSTPKHVLLYKGFDWQLPVFAHLPLLRNADKSKVSKRKNPVSLVWYERAGILPEALLNFLGMMGWTMPDGSEIFSLDDMVQNFSLERIHLGGPVFDLQKLIWVNGKHIRERLDDERLTDEIFKRMLTRDYVRQIVPLVKERIDKLEDFIPYAGFFFAGTLDYKCEELIPKKGTAVETYKTLEELAETVDAHFNWQLDGIEALMREFCERTERKARDVFMSVRVAVTGRTASPGLFETMHVLGREVTRRRLRDAAKALRECANKKQ